MTGDTADTADTADSGRSADTASLVVRRPPGPARAVVLVLHGGAEWGSKVVRPWRTAYLRMVPFARSLYAAGREHDVAVWLLRNRVRGWNEPRRDPVRDARWALSRIRAEHPGVPIVLVGHSMGGRVALRVADDDAVTGVCALAPWTPRGEPVEPILGRDVLIAHGTGDRMTNPADSYAYAERAAGCAARLARIEITDEGHAMLRRPSVWTGLVRDFTMEVLGLPVPEGTVTSSAWTKPDDQRLRISV